MTERENGWFRKNEWRIAALTLHTAYQDGNLELPALATRRAQGAAADG